MSRIGKHPVEIPKGVTVALAGRTITAKGKLGELKLDLTEAAKAKLVDLGYEPAYGARPLKRAILKRVQDPLAEELLAGGFPPGSVVHVDVVGEDFVFKKND